MVLWYTLAMADLRKFYADVQRIQKHTRAQCGSYNAEKVVSQVITLFESNARGLGELPQSISEYWKKTYIDASTVPETEPSMQNIDWLACVLSFLDGELEGDQDLSKKDWKELSTLISYEAEDLPIDVLSSLMTILVEKKAI